MGETPVPIPNTMVKTQAADGTALETVWESRWLPNPKRKKAKAFHIDTDMKEDGLKGSRMISGSQKHVNPTSREVLLR